ncbi:hypothetical protein UlMin_040877 [Ulmus minor]
MASIVLDQTLLIKPNKSPQTFGKVIEEIEGLIRVYKDGKVERPQIVPCVTPSLLAQELGVTSQDTVIDKSSDTWCRFYVPSTCHSQKLPLLVYFHGGGFCVGSASWICYHEFLAKLASKLCCLIMSVNYRLAPENPLPAAYEDGFKALSWLKQQNLYNTKANEWWSKKCDFSRIFLVGDSAGANIAHNLAIELAANEAFGAKSLKPLAFKGVILVQPFFGGQSRTVSEKPDTYWRLALPAGANRDHPWCNPLSEGPIKMDGLKLWPVMVCVSEMDILKDRNLEFCGALARAGKKVEYVVYDGVGHAFQILNKSQLSLNRCNEMMAHIKAFISRY